MSSNKLQPIYTALESQQYNRAIKLCLASPPTALLPKALLAHAYGKSGQRYKALTTIQSIVGVQYCSDYFPELRLELKYCVDRKADAIASAPGPAVAAATKKGGKKGKKKGGGSAAASEKKAPQAVAVVVDEEWDLIDHLDTAPALPDDWDKVPPPDDAIADDTLLSTLAMTMVSVLRLPLTSYQIHCWAASKKDTDEFIVRKAYLSGFAVLVAPQYKHISKNILTHMQVLALQLARVQQQLYRVAPSTSWAAQTALWQAQMVDQDPQKLAMLPRLAETLASKCVHELPSTDRLTATEDFLLYIRTLDSQQKEEVKLVALQKKLDEADEHMIPPRQTVLDLKYTSLFRMKRFSEARDVLELLLKDYPDDWRYWKQHLECSLNESDNTDTTATTNLAESTLASNSDNKYPLRGPRLMKIEVARRRLENPSISSDQRAETISVLLEAIKNIGRELAGRCTCVYPDVAPYVDCLLQHGSAETAKELLEWAKAMRVPPKTENPKECQMMLRSYIFSVNVIHRVLVEYRDWIETELPQWQSYVQVWRDVKGRDGSDLSNKESRPADGLVLLAVQQLLYNGLDKPKLVTAASILEAAIAWSPYNAYLKITAMLVYSDLNAVSRSWQLSKELQIKHIQHESCAFLILPLLQAGGLYREVVSVCQEILRLQTTAAREASDCASRAMENGAGSKAEEFINFQRDRMNKSLTTLEAKGLVLDCAAMYVDHDKQDPIGAVQGIVGGEADVERANQMVAEAYNPCGPFGLLRLEGSVDVLAGEYSDNRDFSVFSHEVLIKREFPSFVEILLGSIRRGHVQRLLIIAVICVEATKGPKKGKVAKSTPELERRCKSLIHTIDDPKVECKQSTYQRMMDAKHAMCRAIGILGAGVPMADSNDTLETREKESSKQLLEAEENVKKAIEGLETDSGSQIETLCRFLPDCLVPAYALCRMCIKSAEIYGWGPRKHKTKPCAAAVFALSRSLLSLIDNMRCSFGCLPDPAMSLEQLNLVTLSETVDIEFCERTISNIIQGQTKTRMRVTKVLDDMTRHIQISE